MSRENEAEWKTQSSRRTEKEEKVDESGRQRRRKGTEMNKEAQKQVNSRKGCVMCGKAVGYSHLHRRGTLPWLLLNEV